LESSSRRRRQKKRPRKPRRQSRMPRRRPKRKRSHPRKHPRMKPRRPPSHWLRSKRRTMPRRTKLPKPWLSKRPKKSLAAPHQAAQAAAAQATLTPQRLNLRKQARKWRRPMTRLVRKLKRRTDDN